MTEQVIRQKLQMLELAEAMAGVGSWRFDVASGMVEWSDEVYRIHGVSRDSFDPNLDDTIALYHADDRPIVAAHAASAIATGTGFTFRLRLVRGDGEIRMVSSSASCSIGPDGRVESVFGVLQDITDGQRTLERAQTNEARYRLLADNMADVVTRIQLNGSSSYISSAIEQLLGYRPREMAGQSSLAFVHPDDRALIKAAFASLTGGEKQRTVQHRAVHKDGSTIWVETRFQVVTKDNGEPSETVAVIRDISERKALEANLAETEFRFRNLAENSSDILIQYGRDGMVKFASGALDLLGYQPEDVVGKSIIAFIAPDHIEQSKALIDGLFLSATVDKSVRREHRVVARDGSVVWLEGNPRVICDASGNPVEIVTVLRDITQKRAAEEALTESEFRYRTLAENSSDILVRFGRDGLVRHISPSCRTLGVDPETAVGQSVLKLVAPEYMANSEAIVASMFANAEVDRSVRREHRVVGNNGVVMWLEGNPQIIRDASGEAVEIVTVLRDVTARRAIEDALIEATRVAEAATEAKSQFLANMSHELRTPLTSIIGFSSLLNQHGGLPEAAAKYAARISIAGQGLLAVINDVLDFSKLEEGAVALDPHPCAVTDVIEDVQGLLSVQAGAKGLELSVEFDADVPAWVMLDELRLRQVLQNLIGNAVKFTSQGGVSVKLSAPDYGRLRVDVRDTGPGLTPEQQGRLFERFAQADASITRRHGGSGLGLSICRELVGLMGGQIGVESAIGQGATFWFELDAVACSAAEAFPEAEQSPFQVLTNVRVLVVDDHEHNRALVTALLAPLGVEVLQAASGAEAVEACLTIPFDLVFMDVQMPGMDGCLATAGIRASCELNARTPIIALTAMSSGSGIDDLFDAGMNDVVNKPIDPKALIGAICAWVNTTEPAGSEGLIKTSGGARN